MYTDTSFEFIISIVFLGYEGFYLIVEEVSKTIGIINSRDVSVYIP